MYVFAACAQMCLCAHMSSRHYCGLYMYDPVCHACVCACVRVPVCARAHTRVSQQKHLNCVV